jgi:hypothetical protein
MRGRAKRVKRDPAVKCLAERRRFRRVGIRRYDGRMNHALMSLRGRGARWLLVTTLACALGCDLFHRELPTQLAGLPLTTSYRDRAALAQLQPLRESHIELRSGAFGVYGDGAASLWVAGAGDTATAQRLMDEVATRIARGDTPFGRDSLHTLAQRSVHELSGLGQRQFYFRSGRRVVWLSATRGHAAAALEEALRFYP